MRGPRMAIVVATLILAGCEMDFGFDLDLSGWGWGCGECSFSTLGPKVAGSMRIGDHPHLEGEATILLYAPADTLTPVPASKAAVQFCQAGVYCIQFAAVSDTLTCGYLARAERWDGARTELKPVFANPPSPCRFGADPYEGAAFTLPDYPPLDTPFTVSGKVYIDHALASSHAAVARFTPRGLAAPVLAPTDSMGTYAFTTRDGAVRFGLCRWAQVIVEAGSHSTFATLGPVPTEPCGDARELPDARIGWSLASWGYVRGLEGPVGHREAHLVLVAETDSLVVADTAWTRDDGSYQLWFPYGAGSECRFVVRATKAGSSQSRALPVFSGSSCVASAMDFTIP